MICHDQDLEEFELVRPHRKDGYRERVRVHQRIDAETVRKLDAIADELRLSRCHLVDVICEIAVDDDGSWLRGEIDKRVRRALARRPR